VVVLDLVDSENYPGHKGQRRALKHLIDLLGLPRELDVHAEALRAHHLEAQSPAQAALIEHLLEGVDRDRAKARRTMAKGLDHLHLPGLQRLLEVPALQHPFQACTLQEAAWACLEPRARTALSDLADLAAHEDATALHRSRIRIKKLRYAVEALEGAFAEPPEALLKHLRNLQTALGEHHDLAALEALLWEAETQLRERARPTLRAGLLDLLGTVAESRRAAYDRFTALVPTVDLPALTLGLRRALGLPPQSGDQA
jgi:CHAD domain-containing protein